jgi:galactose mutarotase-like enzyme
MNHEMIQWISGNVRIEVSTLGAELQSVCVGDGKNFLWDKEDQFWNRVAPNLFPIVGRLKDDKYCFLGQDFLMKQHGFARDCTFSVVENDSQALRLRLVWDEATFRAYPFHFQYDVIYSAQGGLLWVDYEISNLGEGPMLYSVGGHPGFYGNPSPAGYL